MAESAVSSVLSTLSNLAIAEIIFLKGVPDQVESIKSELRSMQGFLKDVDLKHRKGDSSAALLVQEIRNVAYEAENVIAKINWIQRWNNQKKGFRGAVSRYANVFGDLKTLYEEGKKIIKIKEKINEIFQRKDKYDTTKLGETSADKDGTDFSMEDDLNMQRLVSPYFQSEDDIIGFDNVLKTIIVELTDSSSNEDLTYVSLVGIGGIGKSTLANKVFTHPKIQGTLNTFAWIAVSQSYKPIELLKNIMKKTMNIKKEILRNEERKEDEITEQELENMSELEVIKKLHEFLKNKKYLIVLDDIWDIKALDKISYGDKVFPNSNNGSRIILTTRHLQVAKHPNYAKHIHELKLLDNEQSWKLLRRKAFRFLNQVDESTRKELESLGKELAEKCKGLPLALSVLGGFLSKNIDRNIWSKMVNSLDWEETATEKNIVEILALSFHDLPYHLRPCFLYIACFPEDHLISTSKLTKMLIAEGFIPFNKKCSFEETARKYLTELAHRSIIQVVEISKTHGWIKRIRVHDILRDFCIAESEKIGFLKICNNDDDHETSMPDGMTTYRVAFNKSFTNKIGKYMPNLRALIGFNLTRPSFRGLNYLRVLELVSISNISKLPDEIGEMIFLRYIGLRKCSCVKIPSSIEKLIYLQTFDARDTDICLVTGSIWKIPTLRHVYMHFSSCEIIFPKHGELQNVQTFHFNLSPYYLYTKRDIDNFTPKIREFIRTFEENSGIFSFCLDGVLFPPGPLPVLSSHQNLQELELGRFGPIDPTLFPEVNLPPNKDLFPPNLRKLKLSWIYLKDDPMPILELLPSLVVLQLGDYAYVGNKMSCSAGGFLRLQHMSIQRIPVLMEWKIETGSMPQLSRLRLSRCFDLEMQPEELAHLPALKELKLIGMDFPKETCDKLVEKGCKVIIKND
ncbi:hypothetical protein LUZ60_008295 [Juncus effusus]|nr:hypothetical protein LUZ60_008295 [Juncus effusus]